MFLVVLCIGRTCIGWGWLYSDFLCLPENFLFISRCCMKFKFIKWIWCMYLRITGSVTLWCWVHTQVRLMSQACWYTWQRSVKRTCGYQEITVVTNCFWGYRSGADVTSCNTSTAKLFHTSRLLGGKCSYTGFPQHWYLSTSNHNAQFFIQNNSVQTLTRTLTFLAGISHGFPPLFHTQSGTEL